MEGRTLFDSFSSLPAKAPGFLQIPQPQSPCRLSVHSRNGAWLMAFSAAATFAGLLCPSPLPRDRGTRSDEEKLTFHIPIKTENPEDDAGSESLFFRVFLRALTV